MHALVYSEQQIFPFRGLKVNTSSETKSTRSCFSTDIATLCTTLCTALFTALCTALCTAQCTALCTTLCTALLPLCALL